MSEYYSVVYSSSYLAHHGIKGQKWGERRFQNEDGSLTEAGRRRYGVLDRAAGAYARFNQKKYEKWERKYKKARTGIGKRWDSAWMRMRENRANKLNDFKEADNIFDKANAAFGSKAVQRNFESRSRQNARDEGTYWTKKNNAKAGRQARNDAAVARAWKNINEGRGSFKDLDKVKIENVKNGKTTTYGKYVATNIAKETAMNVAIGSIRSSIKNGMISLDDNGNLAFDASKATLDLSGARATAAGSVRRHVMGK